MTEHDLAALTAAPPLMLAEWWCLLNCWGWPEGLGVAEVSTYVRNGRRSEIMRWIEGAIGRERCIAEWTAKRFSLDVPSADGTSVWLLQSRAHEFIDAFQEFKRDAESIEAHGFALGAFSEADVVRWPPTDCAKTSSGCAELKESA